jgi:hypothetical protein
VYFQTALLYTASDGTRRIRVHTMALPVVATAAEVYGYADPEAIVGLLAKMGTLGLTKGGHIGFGMLGWSIIP